MVGAGRADVGAVPRDDVATSFPASGTDDRHDGKVYDVPRLCTSNSIFLLDTKRRADARQRHTRIIRSASHQLQPDAKLEIANSLAGHAGSFSEPLEVIAAHRNHPCFANGRHRVG